MSNLYQMWYNLQHNVDQNWSMQPIVIPWTWHAESQIKNKTNNLIYPQQHSEYKFNITLFRTPTGWGKTSHLFTSVTKDLNSGLL